MYVSVAVYNAFFCVPRNSLVENSPLSEQRCMKVREKEGSISLLLFDECSKALQDNYLCYGSLLWGLLKERVVVVVVMAVVVAVEVVVVVVLVIV